MDNAGYWYSMILLIRYDRDSTPVSSYAFKRCGQQPSRSNNHEKQETAVSLCGEFSKIKKLYASMDYSCPEIILINQELSRLRYIVRTSLLESSSHRSDYFFRTSSDKNMRAKRGTSTAKVDLYTLHQ